METTRPGCLLAILRLLGQGPREEAAPAAEADPADGPLPYRLSDRFMSPAEASFYQVLLATTQNQYLICPKVALGELFFVPKSSGSLAYRNSINRRSVDFLLCDPLTLRPRLAIELDDASHAQPDRQARDAFVDRVFQAASLPILHIPARAMYDSHAIAAQIAQSQQSSAVEPATAVDPSSGVPICPNCGVPMVVRTAQRGERAGSQFYGCPNFPNCRATRDLTTG